MVSEIPSLVYGQCQKTIMDRANIHNTLRFENLQVKTFTCTMVFGTISFSPLFKAEIYNSLIVEMSV